MAMGFAGSRRWCRLVLQTSTELYIVMKNAITTAHASHHIYRDGLCRMTINVNARAHFMACRHDILMSISRDEP